MSQRKAVERGQGAESARASARSLTKLVLLEGMPGSGKSTLAQFLVRRLEANRVPATWFYEEDRDHPLYPFHDVASLQHVVADLFSGKHTGVIADVLSCWRTFAELTAAADPIV